MKIKSVGRRGYLLLAVLPALALGASDTSSKGISTMDYFIGTWECAGHFASSGKAIASTIRFDDEPSLKGIVKHHDDRPPSNYHALEVWVYQPASATFNAAVGDNFGGVREFHSAGWQGDQLIWQSTGIEPAQRFVYVRIDGSRFRLDWDVSKNGAPYVIGDTLVCKRRIAR